MPDPLDFTDLQSFRLYADIKGEEKDELIETLLIPAASDHIRMELSWNVLTSSYSETRNGTGGRALFLSYGPVTAVSLVKINGTTILPQADPLREGYRFDNQMIILNNSRFYPGFGNVQVDYTAGYATVPQDIRLACNELVLWKLRELERLGQVSKSIAGEVITFSTAAMSSGVKRTLQVYKKVVLPW